MSFKRNSIGMLKTWASAMFTSNPELHALMARWNDPTAPMNVNSTNCFHIKTMSIFMISLGIGRAFITSIDLMVLLMEKHLTRC